MCKCTKLSALYAVVLLWMVASASSLSAQENSTFGQAFHLYAGSSLQNKASFELGWQSRFHTDFQIGINVETASYNTAYISALEVSDGWRGQLSVPMAYAFFRRGPMVAHLLVMPLLGTVLAPDGRELDNSVRVGVESGIIIQIRTSKTLSIESGFLVPYIQEVSPESLLDKSGVLLPLGLAWRMSKQVELVAQAHFGPVSGGDGDTAKFVGTASFGLRFGFDDPMDGLVSP